MILTPRLRGAALAASLALALGVGAPAALAAAPSASSSAPAVAWLSAATDADIERAFATAQAEKKPLLLYWGAKWCPPCNQLSATLFNRQDFIERSRAFVPVYVDGDLPGAQKLGARFKVRGYPTMILFSPQGSEITRLPGEVDAPQVLRVLDLGLAGGRPVKAVLADAQAGKPLSANEWRLLAFYSWETDEAQLVPEADRPALLVTLAAASPPAQAEVATRLWLKALAASDEGRGVKADAALRERVARVLADPAAARVQMDVLTSGAAEIVRALDGSASQQAALVGAYDKALQRLEADATLSRADRMSAVIARIDLARIDAPKDAKTMKLPPAARQGRAHARRARRPRDHRRLRAPGRRHGGRLRPRAGGAHGRIRRAAQGQPGQEPFALLPDVGARRATPRRAATRPRRCAGTSRPTGRAKARRRGCSGARATSARSSNCRRRTRRASSARRAS